MAIVDVEFNHFDSRFRVDISVTKFDANSIHHHRFVFSKLHPAEAPGLVHSQIVSAKRVTIRYNIASLVPVNVKAFLSHVIAEAEYVNPPLHSCQAHSTEAVGFKEQPHGKKLAVNLPLPHFGLFLLPYLKQVLHKFCDCKFMQAF